LRCATINPKASASSRAEFAKDQHCVPEKGKKYRKSKKQNAGNIERRRAKAAGHRPHDGRDEHYALFAPLNAQRCRSIAALPAIRRSARKRAGLVSASGGSESGIERRGSARVRPLASLPNGAWSRIPAALARGEGMLIRRKSPFYTGF
jgi:hypothetical protein